VSALAAGDGKAACALLSEHALQHVIGDGKHRAHAQAM
jgi:hypothetical protein